jgi:hypothetical protein
VTSCVLVEGYQMGLACVESRYAKEGATIGIFVLPEGKRRPAETAWDALDVGTQVPLHNQATILTRFPEDEERTTWRYGSGE